ncbi:FecR family protein [Pseudopedobacter beijingensis]|uniref:FecR family protein n=1 Tax=Pseudopedobacter beijingensis TaxID=1207056 RepID=A0ABW4IAX5_9SPHI
MADKSKILYLLERSLQGKSSEEEERELEKILLGEDNASINSFDNELQKQETEEVLLEKIHYLKNKSKRGGSKFYAIAASLLCFLLAGALYMKYSSSYTPPVNATVEKKENYTDENKGVTLTLGDGSVLNLNESQQGAIGNQANVEIHNQEGTLLYKPSSENGEEKVAFNIVNTNRGTQYHLVLSDGTQVWMNGDSELKFPARFNGEERIVSLSGEAYFEVAKDKKPFKVDVKTTTVKVLGTHFNIKAYKDEASLKTTLLEGSVQLSNSGQEKILKPGQEAICTEGKNGITIKEVDAELAIGWKVGLFTFNDEPLDKVLQQIGRWYDKEIIFASAHNKVLFSGVIPVKENLEKSLGPVAEAANVKFTLKDNKIIVNNKY